MDELAALAALATAFATAPLQAPTFSRGQWQRNLWRVARHGVHAELEVPGHAAPMALHEYLAVRLWALEDALPRRARDVLGHMLAVRLEPGPAQPLDQGTGP
jgi:hypothetical protein